MQLGKGRSPPYQSLNWQMMNYHCYSLQLTMIQPPLYKIQALSVRDIRKNLIRSLMHPNMRATGLQISKLSNVKGRASRLSKLAITKSLAITLRSRAAPQRRHLEIISGSKRL